MRFMSQLSCHSTHQMSQAMVNDVVKVSGENMSSTGAKRIKLSEEKTPSEVEINAKNEDKSSYFASSSKSNTKILVQNNYFT